MLDEDQMFPDVDDLDEDAEEAEGIDLFADDFERDYNARENDAYEGADIDDEEYDDMDLATRRALDRRLDARDRAARNQIPKAYLGDDDDEGGLESLMQKKRPGRWHYDEEDDGLGDDVMNEELSLEALADVKASSLTDWVAQPAVARTIAREFKSFLTEYTDENIVSVYGSRIRTLGEVNAESLEVSFDHLSESKATLAYWLANTPSEMLKIFDQVALEVTLIHYPDYERIHQEIHVRITDLPVQYTLR